jgi:small-conductance mechanosensitive channel
MRQLALAALILALTASFGCRSKRNTTPDTSSDTTASSTTPAPEAAPEPAPSTRPEDAAFEGRQEFVQTIRQRLATADRQIQELAAQVKSKGGAVSDRALAAARANRRVVDRDLKRVEAATAANWEQVRNAVNRSVERLSESIEEAQPK